MKNVLVSFLFILFFINATLAQKTLNQNFEGIQEISINIASGDLHIDKANNNEVSLTVEYNDQHLEPQIKQNGKKLALDEKRINQKNSGDTKWTLLVPDELIIQANIGAGKAYYRGIYVKLDHNTGAGNISFSQVSGKLTVNNGVGDISVNQSEGEFNINSGTGSLQLEEVSGRFGLNSGTGNVKVNNGHITGESNLNSGTGNVVLALSKTVAGDLSINSGTGNATLNFNGQPIAGDFEMQCSEKHGSISAPFNFDHTEKIDNGGKNNVTLKKTAKIGSGQPKIKVSTGTGTAAVKK